MTPYNFPIESGLPKAVVDKFASDLAYHLKYEPGADLLPVVEGLGGRISILDVSDFSELPSGSIRIEREGNFEISLAAHTGPMRDRFTIAHELGHYFLHYLYPNKNGQHIERLEAARYGSGRVEWEANWFAAGFLMPSETFISQFNAVHGSLPVLASIFGVSQESARIRASFCGLG